LTGKPPGFAVTATTVTGCDGRDSTSVRYPPFWTLKGHGQQVVPPAHIG